MSAEFIKCRILQTTLIFSETFIFESINALLIHRFHNNNTSFYFSNSEFTKCRIHCEWVYELLRFGYNLTIISRSVNW